MRPTSRSFSVCLRCQFGRQPGFYAVHDEKDKTSNDAERLVKAASEAPVAVVAPEADAGASRAADAPSVDADVVDGRSQGQLRDKKSSGQQEKEQRKEQRDVSTDAPSGGGLPSYLENRRSRLSKQFTTMMDNVQSNVFVAGQRLNDLTGYSGIEALKNEIHSQGKRLRTQHQTPNPNHLTPHSLPQKIASVKPAHGSEKPKTNTQPPSTNAPPRSAK